MSHVIELQNIDVSIDQKDILHKISFSVERGNLLGLIGPNGSGKSTLLKTIAALLPYQRGSLSIHNQCQTTYSHKTLAKQMSYVPQETVIGFDFDAWDIVSMGRHVYSSTFKSDTKRDIEKVTWAMEQTETLHLAEQSILNLSSGQRQLVMIAKALAQDTPIILLDEPISALDVYYQLHILNLLKNLCEKEQKTMIVVLHDLNLASRFCHQLLLLSDGQVQKYGTPADILTEEWLQKVYHVNAFIHTNEHINATTVTPFIEEKRKDMYP